MLLTQLEYFVALAKERHFGKAAEACHVGQSALSEAVHKLEVELGVRLVKRGHAFEGVTDEGEKLLVWARRIVADQIALRDTAKALGSMLTGTLRIGIVPSATAGAARLVDAFADAYTQVTIHIESGLPSEEITQRIRRFELDAGVMYPVLESTSDLTIALIYQERQSVVLHPDLARGRDRIRRDELSALPLVLLNATMRGRQLLDEALVMDGIVLEPRVTTDSIEWLMELVRTGRWAGIVPLSQSSRREIPGGLLELSLDPPIVNAPIVLAILGTEPVSIVSRAIMQLARDGES